MSSVSSPAALPQFISQLLSERQSHVASIATIDATLSRVTAALGGPAAKPVAVAAKPAPVKKAKRVTKAKPAAPTVTKPVAPAKAPVKKAAAKAGPTAHEFVLAFVTAKKSPSTQEVNKHWKESGRLGNADNTLSQLTKLKKLKRSPLPGGVRGSKYAVA